MQNRRILTGGLRLLDPPVHTNTHVHAQIHISGGVQFFSPQKPTCCNCVKNQTQSLEFKYIHLPGVTWLRSHDCVCLQVPDQYGTIRAVSEGKGDEFLVGTSRNFILRGTFNDGFLVEVQVRPHDVIRVLVSLYVVMCSGSQFLVCCDVFRVTQTSCGVWRLTRPERCFWHALRTGWSVSGTPWTTVFNGAARWRCGGWGHWLTADRWILY